jgi:uncharacterized membrane protein YphA (DoxX/SURF4 family)
METHDQAPAHGNKHERWLLEKPLTFWVRLVLGGVFVLASLDKILHPFAFAKNIGNYQILPDGLVNLMAIIVPWIELILGSLLIFGIWLPGAIVLVNLLLSVFFITLVFNMARGLNVDCGCFTHSVAESASTSWYLVRDTVFLLLGGYLFYRVLIKPSQPINK